MTNRISKQYRPKLVKIPRTEIFKLSKKKINSKREELVKFYRIKLQEMNKKGIFEDRINLVRVQNMLRYAISKIDVKEIIRQSREELIRQKNEMMDVKQERRNIVDHSRSIHSLFSQQKKKLKMLNQLVGKKGGSISQSFLSPTTPRKDGVKVRKLPHLRNRKLKKLQKPPLKRKASRRRVGRIGALQTQTSSGRLRRSSSKSSHSSKSRRSSKRGSSSSIEGQEIVDEEEQLLFPYSADPNVQYTLSSILDRFIEYNVDNVSMPSFIRPKGKVLSSQIEKMELEKKKEREDMARRMGAFVPEGNIKVKSEKDEEKGEESEGEGEEKVGADDEVDQFCYTQIAPLNRTKFPSLLEKHFRKEWVKQTNVLEPEDPNLTNDEKKKVDKEYFELRRKFKRRLNRHVLEQKKELESDRFSVFKKKSFDESYVEPKKQLSKDEKKYKDVMVTYKRDALEKKKENLSRRYKDLVPQNTEFPRIKTASFMKFVEEEEEKDERIRRFHLGVKGIMKKKESKMSAEEERKKELKIKARQHIQTLQLCQLLERSITILCREYNEILRTSKGNEQPEIPVLRELLLMSLKLIPVSNSLRAKRSWVKGSEILFLWELDLDKPFSVGDENHMKILASKYVDLYFNNDRILSTTEKMRGDKTKHSKIVKSWEEEKMEFVQTLISRRGVVKGDPFEVALKFLRDHKKLEDDMIKQEDERLRGGGGGEDDWNHLKDFADSDSSGIGSFVYRIYLNNKKLLYVINCYMNYCGVDTQRYFQILVDQFKTRKVKSGLPTPKVDIREEGKDILKNHSFDDFLNFIIQTNQLVELRKELAEKRKELEKQRRLEARKGFNTHLSYIDDMMDGFHDMVQEINKQVEEERKTYSLKKRNKRIESSATVADDLVVDLSMQDEQRFNLSNIRNITKTPLGHEVMRRSIMKKKEVDYYGEMHHLLQDEEEFTVTEQIPSMIDIGGNFTTLEETVEEQEIQRDTKKSRLEYLKELMRIEKAKRGPIKKEDMEKFKPVDLSTPIPRAYSWVELQNVFDEKNPNENEEERKERLLIKAGLLKKKTKKKKSPDAFSSRKTEEDVKNEVKVERKKKKNLATMLEELRKAEEAKKKAREERRARKLELMEKRIGELDRKLVDGEDVTEEIDELQKKIETELLLENEGVEEEGEEEEEGEGEEGEWEEYDVEEEGEGKDSLGEDKAVKPFSRDRKKRKRRRKGKLSKNEEELEIKKLVRQDTLRMEEIRKFFKQKKKGGSISQRNRKRVAELIRDVYERSKTVKKLEKLEMKEKLLEEKQKKSREIIEGVKLFSEFKHQPTGKETKSGSLARQRLTIEHLRRLRNRKSELQQLKDKIDSEKGKLREMMKSQEEKKKERDEEYNREEKENTKVREGLQKLINTFQETDKFDKDKSLDFLNTLTLRLTQVGDNEEQSEATIELIEMVVKEKDKLICSKREMNDLKKLLETMEKKKKIRIAKAKELMERVNGIMSGADFVKNVADELQGRDSEERELKSFLHSFVEKEEKKRKERLEKQGIRIRRKGKMRERTKSGKLRRKKRKRKMKKKKKKRIRRKKRIKEEERMMRKMKGEEIEEEEEEGEGEVGLEEEGEEEREGEVGESSLSSSSSSEEEDDEEEGEDDDDDDDDDEVVVEEEEVDVQNWMNIFSGEFSKDYSSNLKKRLRRERKLKRRKSKVEGGEEDGNDEFGEEQRIKKKKSRLSSGGKKRKSWKEMSFMERKEEKKRMKKEKDEVEKRRKMMEEGIKLYDEDTGIRRGSENWHIVLEEKKGNVINNSKIIIEKLKGIWERLRYSPLEIINFEQRFNDPPYVTQLPLISQLFNMWKCATDLVLKREKILGDMFEFEKKQVLKGNRKMKRRIETSIEKKRVFYFKLLTKLGMECEKISVQLLEEHEVELKFQGLNYVEKMKNDYDAVLYAIEGRYLRSSGFNHYEEVMDKITQIVKDMKKKRYSY